MFTSFDQLFDFDGDGKLSSVEQAVEYMFLDDMSEDEDEDEEDDEEDNDEEEEDEPDNYDSDDEEEDDW